MVRKKIPLVILIMSLSLGGHVMANTADPLNIIGDYKCTGYDSHDGVFQGDLSFTLDEQASHFQQSFGAYQFKLKVSLAGEVATYSGFAAAQGQSLAMYFANDSQQAPTDRGVGIASITHDQDANGKYITTLHKSYYLPDYMRTAKDKNRAGGRGTEVCIKKTER